MDNGFGTDCCFLPFKLNKSWWWCNSAERYKVVAEAIWENKHLALNLIGSVTCPELI